MNPKIFLISLTSGCCSRNSEAFRHSDPHEMPHPVTGPSTSQVFSQVRHSFRNLRHQQQHLSR